jgi:hypothetical protein
MRKKKRIHPLTHLLNHLSLLKHHLCTTLLRLPMKISRKRTGKSQVLQYSEQQTWPLTTPRRSRIRRDKLTSLPPPAPNPRVLRRKSQYNLHLSKWKITLPPIPARRSHLRRERAAGPVSPVLSPQVLRRKSQCHLHPSKQGTMLSPTPARRSHLRKGVVAGLASPILSPQVLRKKSQCNLHPNKYKR